MDLIYWNILISTIADLSDGLPLIFLLRDAPARHWKILRTYFAGNFSVKLFTIFLIFGLGARNTLPFYHFLSVFEFCCLFIFFSQNIGAPFKNISIPFALVITFNVINTLFFQSLWEFNSFAWGVNTVVLMFLAFVYLYRLYSAIDDISIEKHPEFICCAAFLIYFAGSLFTYLLGWNILSQYPEGFFANGWIIQSLATFVKNIIVTYGLRQRVVSE